MTAPKQWGGLGPVTWQGFYFHPNSLRTRNRWELTGPNATETAVHSTRLTEEETRASHAQLLLPFCFHSHSRLNWGVRGFVSLGLIHPFAINLPASRQSRGGVVGRRRWKHQHTKALSRQVGKQWGMQTCTWAKGVKYFQRKQAARCPLLRRPLSLHAI